MTDTWSSESPCRSADVPVTGQRGKQVYDGALEAARTSLESGDFLAALAAGEALVARWPGRPRGWIALIDALLHVRRRAGAVERALEATRRFPSNGRIWLWRARAQFHAGKRQEGQSALSRARALGAAERECRRMERLDARVARRMAGTEFIELGLQARIEAMGEPRRPLLVDRPEAEVQVAAGAHGSDAVVVFTGLADRVAVSLEVLDRFFAARGLTAVYCRDLDRLLGTRGILSLGANVAETAGALRALLDRHGAARTLVMGNSAGGFTAIRYGLLLGASTILSFAGPTNATRAFLERIGDRRGAGVGERLERLVPAGELDLAAFVGAAPTGTQVQLHYGGAMPEDSQHADHLRGLAAVSLVPDPLFDKHHILIPLMLDGRFEELLDAALG